MNVLPAILGLVLVRVFRRAVVILLLICLAILAGFGILTGMIFHRPAPPPPAESPDAVAWVDFGILTGRVFSKKNLRTEGFRTEAVGYGNAKTISWMIGTWADSSRDDIFENIAPWQCDGIRLEFNDGIFRARIYLHCDRYSILWGGATTITVDFIPEIDGERRSAVVRVTEASAGDIPLPSGIVENILNRQIAAAVADGELWDTVRGLKVTDRAVEVEYDPAQLVAYLRRVPLLAKWL